VRHEASSQRRVLKGGESERRVIVAEAASSKRHEAMGVECCQTSRKGGDYRGSEGDGCEETA
jgi:hypothetical protein